MAFKNLKAEMTRGGITQSEVADSLGMTTGNLNLKINERIPMTVEEAKAIKSDFFPNLNLDYLLTSDGDLPTMREREAASRPLNATTTKEQTHDHI